MFTIVPFSMVCDGEDWTLGEDDRLRREIPRWIGGGGVTISALNVIGKFALLAAV